MVATPLDTVVRRLIAELADGDIASRAELQKRKLVLVREHRGDRVPADHEILAQVPEHLRDRLLSLLRTKATRSASGVAVVALMTPPEACPHGRCIYCPGGPGENSPQSYTGFEPAALRGRRNDYDAYLQMASRLRHLERNGHPTTKVEVIVMGGTFPARRSVDQWSWVKGAYDAMNQEPSETLKEAVIRNETAFHRCIGLTVETRPSEWSHDQIAAAMTYGCTRVEMGVQVLDESVLRAVGRDHGVQEVVDATRRTREAGLKMVFHIMLGLPGMTPGLDLDRFQLLWDDPRFRPDMLKIYPTLVMSGTTLSRMYERGDFTPYSDDQAAELIASMKALVPPYVRIQRIQRDIPARLIDAGVTKGDIRLVARRIMAARGTSCRCIRCREVGLLEDHDAGTPELRTLDYQAAGGTEVFTSLETHVALHGFVRLRLDDQHGTVRELRVYGRAVAIDSAATAADERQHRGFGRELMAYAEERTRAAGLSRLRVTAGVGTREYYRKLGFRLQGFHMIKDLG